MTAEHEARSWLRAYGAESIEHPGGTLYGHLGRVHDRFTGRVVRLHRPELRDLADLSIVNELDVAEQSPEILHRHGGYFQDVFGSWASIASPQIVADAERVLLYQVP